MDRLPTLAFAAACLCGATAAQAAGFFGSLTVDGQLPGRPTAMRLVCAGQQLATTNADARGSYQFGLERPARDCFVWVENAKALVVIYPNPTRYDFALTHGSGGAQLSRR